MLQGSERETMAKQHPTSATGGSPPNLTVSRADYDALKERADDLRDALLLFADAVRPVDLDKLIEANLEATEALIAYREGKDG